ncbi:RING-H2 finger protein [Candidatus Dependentiae bacterium]|nr:MAG: RING-H2 finger protein [Candidatus Dependentiae bacterium]
MRKILYKYRLYRMLSISDISKISLNDSKEFMNNKILETKNEYGEDLCPISMELLTPENTKITPCGHKFIKDNLDKWLESNNTCPICRRSVKEKKTRTINEMIEKILIDATTGSYLMYWKNTDSTFFYHSIYNNTISRKVNRTERKEGNLIYIEVEEIRTIEITEAYL